MTSPAPARTLRDRKRERTRLALIDAAADLFERRGYDRTTVADIAAAADIGTRTFFSYFASKEELLFPESDARVAAVSPHPMLRSMYVNCSSPRATRGSGPPRPRLPPAVPATIQPTSSSARCTRWAKPATR